MQKYTITRKGCPECGSNEFYLKERTTYKASVNQDGTLESYGLEDYKIERITCKECKAKYTVDDFIDIELGVW
jgi:hypothetical protein